MSEPSLIFEVIRCGGGYNVHGRGVSGHLYFECLHLHSTVNEATRCAEKQRAAAGADTEPPEDS